MANRNFLVGMFIVVGLTLFTVGTFLVGDRHEAFAHHIEFYMEFTNLVGLTKGSKVKVAGMDAGQIVEVGVPNSPASPFRVKFQINQGLHGLVRTDSVTTIATEGVVGGTYLLVRSGSPNAPAAGPLATLPSQEPIDMSKQKPGGESPDRRARQLSWASRQRLWNRRSSPSRSTNITSRLASSLRSAPMLLVAGSCRAISRNRRISR